MSRVLSIFAAFLVAQATQAGPWGEFEGRCLMPAEAVAPFRVEGLEASAEAPWPDMTGYALPYLDTVLFAARADAVAQSCGLVIPDAELDGFLEDLTRWSLAAAEARRYRTQALGQGAAFWSAEWKDPAIVVEYAGPTRHDAAWVRVVQTSLKPGERP